LPRTNKSGENFKKKSITGFASTAQPAWTQKRVATKSIKIRIAKIHESLTILSIDYFFLPSTSEHKVHATSSALSHLGCCQNGTNMCTIMATPDNKSNPVSLPDLRVCDRHPSALKCPQLHIIFPPDFVSHR